MKLHICCLIVSIVVTFFVVDESYSQTAYNLKGFIIDSNTADTLVGASIRVNHASKLVSNLKGQYQISLSKGPHSFEIIHLGYDTLYQSVNIYTNEHRNFYITRKPSNMAEVIIEGKKQESGITANTHSIGKRDLEKVPAFLGQRDPIASLKTLPGTANAGEGNSGIYVRGGEAGQNLTIFNGATIYNPSHLLGFFSVFNSDAVDNIKLYKSGIPAQFGGRLSSLIEVESSKNIADTLSLNADISLLAVNASVSTPVTKNWSVFFSARQTFMGLTIWPLMNSLNVGSKLFSKLNYDFSDLNFTSNLKLSDRDYIYISAFASGDTFDFGLKSASISNAMNWKNQAYSIAWSSHLKKNISLNTIATFSGYNFNLNMLQANYEAGVSSKIKDYSLKSTIAIVQQKHKIKLGFQTTLHNFKPNTPYSKVDGTEFNFGFPNKYNADEASVFLSDEYNISEKINLYTGARITHYRHKGPYKFIDEDGTESDFLKNKTIAGYTYLEPSLIIENRLSKNSSIKLSFTRNVQPLHLISVTAVNFPSDFWLPSLKNLPPEKGLHFSAGYFLDLKSKKYESYFDLYYKSMSGLLEYSGGIMNLLDNLKIEDRLSFGKGQAYGAEIYIKKKTGKLTGWLGYTLAKSDRSFEEIENNRSFAAKYDRRHDVSLLSNLQINSNWTIAGYFTYATGNTYTKPVSRYIMSGNIVNEYGKFNGSRMPPYHRMDLSATYKLNNRGNYKNELGLSVYNVYNRQNPIFLYFVAKGDLEKNKISIKPESISILPVLPSLTYRCAF